MATRSDTWAQIIAALIFAVLILGLVSLDDSRSHECWHGMTLDGIACDRVLTPSGSVIR